MKWLAKIDKPRQLKLEIVKELFKDLNPNKPDTYGYYLYVWENNRCTYDYLQDTLEIAIEQAEEDFGVPKNAWTKVE
ncbi:MAG TPA: hypothetical protein DD400_02005 [Rhodospirillaceae bacterium]|nr:hypothetical protein [Rhodospirillaceae bacterium]